MTALIEIQGNLRSHCDALRMLGGSVGGVVLLSMFGPRQAVRAHWATLVKVSGRGKRTGSIKVGDSHVTLADGVTYRTESASLGQGMEHKIMFHPMLSRNAPDAGYFYQVGPDAASRYFSRLEQWCPVPLRASWCAPLWNLGRKHDAITLVSGHGVEVWHVSTKRETWEPIVQAAITGKELV